MTQLTAGATSGLVHSAFLTEALCALETIEAVVDPTRDGFAPTSFPPKVAPDMRPQRLMLAQLLLIGHAHPSHLRAAA